ncbi:MAG: hypothetical protein ACM30E_10335, partial [Nitrososphaerales archaeon]
MTDQERLEGGAGTQLGQDDARARAHLAAADAAAASGPGAQPWLLAGLKAREAFLESTVELLRDGQGEPALSQEALSQEALSQEA